MTGLVAALDHVIVAVTDVEEAARPFEKLGLRLTPVARRADRATVNRAFFAGSTRAEFYVELLAVDDPVAAAATPRAASLVEALSRGGGPLGLAFATEDPDGVRAALAKLPGGATESLPLKDDGTPVARLFRPAGDAGLGCAVSILHYPEPLAARRTRHANEGLFAHAFPLRRLDHVAMLVPDLEAATRAWADVLGVPVHGEVSSAAIVVRQMKVGDAVVELLAAASPESPVAARPAGLLPTAAFEVADLDASVAHARSRGFTVTDPAPGFLPGTRTATVAADELAGLALQLLQYV